ncbi:MAG: phage antirepressor KilAC domain-containing protein [Arachnia sp.]
MEPNAANYDHFLSGNGPYSVGNVAKMLGLSQNKLFHELRSTEVLIAKGAMANQRHMHHFAVKAYPPPA